MASLNFVLIGSSVREGRMGERMIKLVQAQFDAVMKPKGHSLKVVDPENYDLPLLKKPLHFYEDPSEAPEILRELSTVIKEADAYMLLVAEYNRSLPPALTNTLDHISPTNFEYKPSAMVSYSMGPRSGLFACAAGLPYLTELGCLPIKALTAIATVQKEVKEDGTTENTHIVSSLGKQFKQLEWWATACKNQRDNVGKP